MQFKKIEKAPKPGSDVLEKLLDWKFRTTII